MDYSSEYDDAEIKMLNGRSIMNALTFLNYEASEDELLKHFVRATGHPENLVKEELDHILEYALTNGFIMKNDNKYLLPRLVDIHQVDGPPRKNPLSNPSRAPSSGLPLFDFTIIKRHLPDGTVKSEVVLNTAPSSGSTNSLFDRPDA